jgi:hypothetical protein
MMLSAQDAFWATRGHAIQAYAQLEQSLFRLFAHLTGLDHQPAGTIFFKITSSAARNAIIEKLFKQKLRDEFNLFRNSLITQIRPIDIQRNEIVHWNATNIIFPPGSTPQFTVALAPPTY